MFDYASFRFWPVSEEQLQDGKVRNLLHSCPLLVARVRQLVAGLTPTRQHK